MSKALEFVGETLVLSIRDTGWFPVCESSTCDHWQKCANHSSAGQYREESGDTPLVHITELITSKGEFFIVECERGPAGDMGGLLIHADGSTSHYTGPEDY